MSATLNAFLYSKRQGELVGADGELVFNRLFGEQARIVVVLYRDGWGSTPFTRFEQTAIKNRAYSSGYDFVLLIPLDQPPAAPPWLPKTRIWYDLGRFGEDGAVAIIEDRVPQVGGEPQAETPEQHLARLGKDAQAAREREGLLLTQGLELARKEVGSLFRELERIAEASHTGGFPVEAERNPQDALVMHLRGGGTVTATLAWQNPAINSLNNSCLRVIFTQAMLLFAPQMFLHGDPARLGTLEFAFDLTRGLQPIWRPPGNAGAISTQALAERVIRSLADHIRKVGGI